MESQNSLPFLTDTQRAALDAALAAKQRNSGAPLHASYTISWLYRCV